MEALCRFSESLLHEKAENHTRKHSYSPLYVSFSLYRVFKSECLLRDNGICVTDCRSKSSLWCPSSNMDALSQPITSAIPSECHHELALRLNILRRNQSFCDVKVAVKDKELAAHKAVLAAASPFFLSLLTSDMRESKEHLIRIELEEATASVMEDVLQYIYTGYVSVTEENAHNLMATADYLLLPGLKTVVGRYLMGILKTENCVFNYYFADKYHCVELKEKACKMINSDFSAVMETDDFLSLDIKQVMEWVSSDDITVNAEEVFEGIVKWVSYDRSEREVEFPGLLRHVHLVSISHNYLLNKLVKEDLVSTNTLCLNFVLDCMRLMFSATDEQCVQQPRKCLEMYISAIFACGGRRSLCYFPKENVWYKLSDMLFQHDNRNNPSQCRGKIYIPCCGTDQLGGSNLIEFYTPAANSWAASEVSTTFTLSAVLKGYVYGIRELGLWFSQIYMYRYDPERNRSYELKKPPSSQHLPCVVTDEQHIYLIGGKSNCIGCAPVSTTYRFDPSADDHEWEELAPLNQARYDAFGAAMNGKVYIAGGCQSQGQVLNTCEVYNPLTNEWQQMPSLKVPRMSASMVCHEGRLYVLGGVNNLLRVLSVEIFNSEQSKWKEKSIIPVDRFETCEEQKQNNAFKACSAKLCKGVIDELVALNM